MFDPNRFQLFDAARTLTLTIGPVSRSDVLADFPAELIVSDEILAARLGVEPVPPSVITARIPELKALDEESVRRLWVNPVPTSDGRTVFVSPVDALPDTGDAADWGLRSAGFLVSDPAVLGEAVAIMEASGSIDYARSYAENLTSIAKNRLTDMVRPSTARDLLVSMADWFVSRLK